MSLKGLRCAVTALLPPWPQVRSYDFKFGFCIPGSTNTWDAVYSVPPLDEGLIREMVRPTTYASRKATPLETHRPPPLCVD